MVNHPKFFQGLKTFGLNLKFVLQDITLHFTQTVNHQINGNLRIKQNLHFSHRLFAVLSF